MSERAKGGHASGDHVDPPDASAVAAAVLEGLPLPVLVRDLEGRIRYANAEARRWLRDAGDELLGSFGESVLPADQIAGFLRSDQRALRSAESQTDDQLRWNPAFGHDRLIRTVKRRLVDATDAPTGVVVVLLDITEDNAQVVAPRQAQERLGSIIESALDAIITCDSDGRVLIFNAAAERMFGLRREDILGQSLDQLVPLRHRGGIWRRCASSRKSAVGTAA